MDSKLKNHGGPLLASIERRLFLKRGLSLGALSLLSGMSVADLVHAVAAQEAGRLTKVPGIGKKTAERLLLELKDKLGAELTAGVAVNRAAPARSDVPNALLSLGYNEKEALYALKQLPEGLSVSDGIRQALKLLAKA